MTHLAQNINHSAFRSMFEREKLLENNFKDLFRQLKLVLRVEKKMYVVEQPIPPAPATDSAANEIKSMFEKQAGVERCDLIQTFWAYKQEDGKPVGAYVLKIKDYMEQLEPYGYVLLQDLSVGLILNGFTSDFVGFVRNYNMHNMWKKIDELHALLIEYEKGLPKKATTPQLMAIQGGRIQKTNKKSQKAKGKGKGKGKGKDKSYIPKPKNPKPSAKEHTVKNDVCLHYKECFIDYGISISKNDSYFNVIPSNGIYEIDMSNLVPNVNSIYNVSNKRVKHNWDSTYLWHCRLDHISKKRIEMLQHDGLLKSTDDESFDQCVFKNEVENQLGKTIKALQSDRGDKYNSQEFKDYLKACGIVQQLTPLYTPQNIRVSERRNRYPKETMGYYSYFPPENEIVVASKIPMEVEGFKPPHEEEAPVRRFVRTHRALECLCVNVEVEEHSLRDLNEPANYKATMLDSESNKWLDAINAKMQSMKDNQG
nr:hypothetical protein [Tanacetum cinerariifolium]